ncbi:hypothetical protein RSAG8_02721, partial [Rhizoctonia solani AG-8 WAC10335]
MVEWLGNCCVSTRARIPGFEDPGYCSGAYRTNIQHEIPTARAGWDCQLASQYFCNDFEAHRINLGFMRRKNKPNTRLLERVLCPEA